MSETALYIVVAIVLLVALEVWILRWILMLHRIVRALEAIDASLRTLPTVRAYDAATRRPPARAA